jgi:hypothetical protein
MTPTARTTSLAVLLLALPACTRPTAFEGEAKFPGGARGCYDRCAAEGLEMASFVYVGEYSTACACQMRRAAPGPVSEVGGPGPAIAAATAGTELQQRRIQEQQRAQQNYYK